MHARDLQYAPKHYRVHTGAPWRGLEAVEFASSAGLFCMAPTQIFETDAYGVLAKVAHTRRCADVTRLFLRENWR
jgi:hypothetical protein